MAHIDMRKKFGDKYCKKVWSNHITKTAYIPIAKNGTHTMGKLLKPIGYDKENYFEGVDDYFTFTILRNPFERFISAFIKASLKVFEKRWKQGKMFTNEQHWDRFTRTIELCSKGHFWNEHMFPQIDYLKKPDGGRISIDFYMVIEKFDQDLKKLNLKLNTSLKPEKHYICHYIDLKRLIKERLKTSPKYVNKINNIYKKDWDLYNKYA